MRRGCFQNNPPHEGSRAPSSRCLLSSRDRLQYRWDWRFVSFLQAITLQTHCVHQASRVLTKALILTFVKSVSPATRQCPQKQTRKRQRKQGPPSSVLSCQRKPTDQLLIITATKDVVSRLQMTCSVALGSIYSRESGMVLMNGGSKPQVKGATTRCGPKEVAVARASYSSPTEPPPAGLPALWVGEWVDRKVCVPKS